MLAREDIPREDAALRLIARAGDGSMRDALSLLDQAIAFGGGRVEQAAVSAMLGSIDRRQVVGLLEALAANDAPALLRQVAELDETAPDYAAVLAELLSLLQQVALVQVVPGAAPDDGVAEPGDCGGWPNGCRRRMSSCFIRSPCWAGAICRWRPIRAAVSRWCCCGCYASGRRRLETAVSTAPASVVATRVPAPAPTPPVGVAQPSAPSPAAVPAQPVSAWGSLVEQLDLGGMAKQLALNCALVAREGNDFWLGLEPAYAQMLTITPRKSG